jgi:hypothetical protein
MLIHFYHFYGKIYFYTSHIWPQGGMFAHSSKHSGKFFSLNYCPEGVVYAQRVSKHSGKVPVQDAALDVFRTLPGHTSTREHGGQPIVEEVMRLPVPG